MKQKQFKTNVIGIVCLTLLFSISGFAQFICEMGERDYFYQSEDNEEYSGLAYHPRTGVFFMPTDDPVRNASSSNIYMKAYNPANQIDPLFEVSFSNFDQLTGFDFEGFTHLKDDYFVLLEEDQNKIYFLEYINSDPNNAQFKVLSGHETNIPFADVDIDDPDGLEGLSYDPNTGRLYLVRERFDIRLYSIPLTLPYPDPNPELNPDSLGDIDEDVQQISNVKLDIERDAGGLFHLGQIYATGHPLSNNMLVTSKFSRKLWEFSVSLDANDNLHANSITLVREEAIDDVSKAEGIEVVDNTIYISNETSQGGLSSYDIKTKNDSCDDGDANTVNDRYDANCNCVDIPPIPGCTDETACNYQPSANVDDNSCDYPEPNFDCENNCLVVGEDCNDNNPNTTGDIYDANCNCAGLALIPGCTDETACNFEAQATVDDNSCNYPETNFDCDNNCIVTGNTCNDNNPDTENDIYDKNCVCVGESSCPTDVVIKMNIAGATLQNSYESSLSIQTEIFRPIGIDVIIREGEAVDLKSGRITLNEGFTVMSGGCLNAEIKPCE